MKTNKKAILVLFLIVSLLFSPITAFADEENKRDNIGDVEVRVGNDGQLEIKGGGFEQDEQGAWNTLLIKYHSLIVGVAGIGAVTMIALFIVNFIKLGASAGNPQARSNALMGLLWTGCASAGLGAVTLIVGIFYNAI